MSLLWMEYETEFEHLVENGDHAQYHPDDGRNWEKEAILR